jgi:hypothetical protein
MLRENLRRRKAQAAGPGESFSGPTRNHRDQPR